MRAAANNRPASRPLVSLVSAPFRRTPTSGSSRARRAGLRALVAAGVLAAALGAAAAPARADEGRPLLVPGAARPQPQGGTPLVAPGPTSTTPTSVVSGGAGTTKVDPKNDPVCRNKLKLVAQLEREKARALTLLARATDRLDRAKGTARPAVVGAFQKEVDSNQERVEELQDQLDALRLRCA